MLTIQTPDTTAVILNHTSNTVEFEVDGKRNKWVASSAAGSSAEDLRTLAHSNIDRAHDLLRRAAVQLALAEIKKAEAVEHAEAAAKQRRERAAATRAKNADPFGYNAILGRS